MSEKSTGDLYLQRERARPKMLERADFFNSLMDDMEHDWADFINSVMSFCTYGFCVNEKVYKKRQGKKGKYQSKI